MPPPVWPNGISQERGVGMYTLRPPAAGMLYLRVATPSGASRQAPHEKGIFRGGGGGGVIGDGPSTVSESTVSNTERSEFFWAH